ncbi:MAG TPA: GntG family PLP-dependent aldolase [Bacteroidales bacterium]|nr:GntG family PLP-dependent aldolase [Bacteroidales bacterium]HRZ49877.1 GntG family PLP-dependent aldolase [Bacteroidales bacterium]
MQIDLRSDTVTKPTPEMLAAMLAAEVGDDVFGDDPTVIALEKKAAALFGMEEALFCVSGTMSNQLAVRVHCAPGNEVICDSLSHVYLYEGGGIALNAFSSVRTLQGDRGRLSVDQIGEAINNPRDVHQPLTRLVSLENTVNKGGGSLYDFGEILKIREVCDQHGLALHLDGARLFNALAETAQTAADYGHVFDSISVCLSKGLGCPVGSLLLGDADLIQKARRFRKVMGGGWRQAGYLAAAGIYALDHHVERLSDDHRRAKAIGRALEGRSFVKSVYPIETNIVIFEMADEKPAAGFVKMMGERGIHCVTFGKYLVRFVTHLGFDDQQLEILLDSLPEEC